MMWVVFIYSDMCVCVCIDICMCNENKENVAMLLRGSYSSCMRGFGGRRKGKEEWICNYIFRNLKNKNLKRRQCILFFSSLPSIE